MPAKAYKPSEEHKRLVASMASVGDPHEKISRVLGITPKTLRKYYAEELATSAAKADLAVKQKLFQQCMEGNTTALIFWLKCRAGWRQDEVIQHVGADGGAITLEIIDKVMAKG